MRQLLVNLHNCRSFFGQLMAMTPPDSCCTRSAASIVCTNTWPNASMQLSCTWLDAPPPAMAERNPSHPPISAFPPLHTNIPSTSPCTPPLLPSNTEAAQCCLLLLSFLCAVPILGAEPHNLGLNNVGSVSAFNKVDAGYCHRLANGSLARAMTGQPLFREAALFLST